MQISRNNSKSQQMLVLFRLGAVLSQVQDNGNVCPIAFASRALSKAEKRYLTTERKLLAIVYALEIFRPYLFGQKFLLLTDHEPLKYIKEAKHPSDRVLRWIYKLSEFDYDVQYKPGIINEADAFSRAPVASIHANMQSDDDTDRQLIELEGPLTINEIWDAQLIDETLRQLRDGNDDTRLTKSSTERTLLRRIGDIF